VTISVCFSAEAELLVGHADCMRWCDNKRLLPAETELLVGHADCMRWCDNKRLLSAEFINSLIVYVVHVYACVC
jgi:hypothetical protein